MKKFFFSIVFLSLLLYMGCQEDSVINPTSINPVDKSKLPAPTITSGTVSLDGILRFPGKSRTFYKINGSVKFTNEIVPIDPIPPAPQFYIKVTLTTYATLDYSDKVLHNPWFISSTSEDHLYNVADGVYKLEKIYRVQGRNDGLALVCRFLVTTNSVKLDGEWLTIAVSNSAASNY